MSGTADSLARAGIVTMAIQGLGQALMFAAFALVARVIGPGEYGGFAIVLAAVNAVLIFARAGQDMVVLREVPALRIGKQWSELASTWWQANRIVAGVSISGALLLGAAALWTELFPPSVRGVPAVLGIATLPLLALGSLRFSALLGLGHAYTAQAVETVIRPVVVLVVAAIALAGASAISAQGVLLANLAGAVLAFAVGQSVLASRWPGQLREASPRSAPPIMLTGLTLLVGLGAYQVMSQVDVLLVGSMLGQEAAGFYSAAGRISIVVQYGLIALQLLAMPRIAAALASRDTAAMQILLSRVAWLSTLFAVPVAIAVALGAQVLLSIFGDAFVAGADVLRIMVFAHIINAATGVTGGVLAMTGHQVQLAVITAAHLLIQTGLLRLVLLDGGIEGAAWVTAFATSSAHVVMALVVRRRLRVTTWLSVPGQSRR